MTKVLTRSLKGILIVTAICATLGLLLAAIIFVQIPSREKIRGCMTTEMYKVALCPGSKDYVVLNKISKHLQQAVVVTEDSAFFEHHGFDFKEIQNSFEKNLEQGRFARGGSTITQQLAKNLFLSSAKSLQRKILEAVITLQLEKHLNKREILERYLNVVQFGKDIYGVKQAAQFYFKKSPANLDVIESAFLTFLLPSPEKYSVSYYKKRLTPFAKKRLQQITSSLYRYGRIEPADYRMALGRTNNFLAGGPAVAAPEGLDLNAPEEVLDGNWDQPSEVFSTEMPDVDGLGASPENEGPSGDDGSFTEEEEELLLQPDGHTTDGPSSKNESQDDQDQAMHEQNAADLSQTQ